MSQPTSIEVYHQILAEGLLPRLQLVVYADIVAHPGTTQGEVVERIKQRNPEMTDSSITPRFAELEARRAISSGEIRSCRRTGRETLTWFSTCQLPIGSPVRLSEKEILRRKVIELEAKVVALEAELWQHRHSTFQNNHQPTQTGFLF